MNVKVLITVVLFCIASYFGININEDRFEQSSGIDIPDTSRVLLPSAAPIEKPDSLLKVKSNTKIDSTKAVKHKVE